MMNIIISFQSKLTNLHNFHMLIFFNNKQGLVNKEQLIDAGLVNWQIGTQNYFNNEKSLAQVT